MSLPPWQTFQVAGTTGNYDGTIDATGHFVTTEFRNFSDSTFSGDITGASCTLHGPFTGSPGCTGDMIFDGHHL